MPDIDQVPQLSYGPRQAAGMLGISERQVYKLLAAGVLASVKLGGRTLIRHEALVDLLDEAEASS